MEKMSGYASAMENSAKPGFKTSEFWLTLSVNLLNVLLVVLGNFHSPTSEIVASIVSAIVAMFTTLGYQRARMIVKSQVMLPHTVAAQAAAQSAVSQVVSPSSSSSSTSSSEPSAAPGKASSSKTAKV